MGHPTADDKVQDFLVLSSDCICSDYQGSYVVILFEVGRLGLDSTSAKKKKETRIESNAETWESHLKKRE